MDPEVRGFVYIAGTTAILVGAAWFLTGLSQWLAVAYRPLWGGAWVVIFGCLAIRAAR